MAIPDYQSLMLPILKLASDGEEHRNRDAVAQLGQEFQLTEEELTKLTASGQDYLFSNRNGWARTYLKKAGLIRYASRGKFQITDAGRSVLQENPEKIDLVLLKRFPEFLEYWNGTKVDAEQPAIAVIEPEPSEETPEELIASAHTKLRQRVQADLLEKIISGTPKAFEQLVISLLTKMGYGGSLTDAGLALGRPHDGGIDGVIKEDKLGLDRIYIQAKKWRDTTVGSVEVQGFVGALAGKRARRGVFITTSRFTREAINYAASLENSVILVDGDRLTELMFEYGLGVSTLNTYEVKRVDSDFFDDEV